MYAEPLPSENFGMHVPELSEDAYFVDVIARKSDNMNYAPIVAQNHHVLFGLSGVPQSWTKEYRALFLEIASALRTQEKKAFAKAEHALLGPGKHAIALAQGLSTKQLSGKTYYFQFTKPTTFTATLEHDGSNSMMMLFMGQKGRLHWTRQDSRNGEPMSIFVEITADDIKRMGENYWTLKVNNFDANNASSCVLDVRYELSSDR